MVGDGIIGKTPEDPLHYAQEEENEQPSAKIGTRKTVARRGKAKRKQEKDTKKS